MDNEEWAERKKKERLADSVKQIQQSIDAHKKSPLYKTGKLAVSNPTITATQAPRVSKSIKKDLQERYAAVPSAQIEKEKQRILEKLDKIHAEIHTLEQQARPLQIKVDEFWDVLTMRSREIVLCEIDEKAAKLMIPALEAMGKRVKIVYGETKFKPCKVIELVMEG